MSYTIAEACQATGISRSKLYELIGTGTLRTFKLGSRTLIKTSALAAMIDQLATAA
jgi:excisionase family DNA binding protein